MFMNNVLSKHIVYQYPYNKDQLIYSFLFKFCPLVVINCHWFVILHLLILDTLNDAIKGSKISTKDVATGREIPTVPERVLDAPDYVDDYCE